MNTITVTAYGSSNSFARRVQHDPSIAIRMLSEVKEVRDKLNTRALTDRDDRILFLANKLTLALEEMSK